MNRTELFTLLATRILDHNLPHPTRVAIDGIDASGKTTLADELASFLLSMAFPRPVLRSSIDCFHNPREFRYRRGSGSPDGYYYDSFNLEALADMLLKPLGPGGSRRVRTSLFDFRTDSDAVSAILEVPEETILIFDGVFLQRSELEHFWDFKIFVHVSFETALARALKRDVELIGTQQSVIERYIKRYIPAQQMYLGQCQPAERADIVIVNEDPVCPVLG